MPERTLMSTLTLPLLDAKELSKALVPHVTRDNITPILTHIVVGGDYGSFAYATDRYTIGRFDLTNIIVGEAPAETFWIPGAALAAVGNIGDKSLPDNMIALSEYRVQFERIQLSEKSAAHFQVTVLSPSMEKDQEGVFYPVWMRTWRVPSNPGNFPPLAKLFTDFLPSEREVIHLQAEQLSKFTSYAKTYKYIGLLRITMTAPSGGRNVAPILVEIGNRFKGLVQESLVLDPKGFGRDLGADNKARVEAERIDAEAVVSGI